MATAKAMPFATGRGRFGLDFWGECRNIPRIVKRIRVGTGKYRGRTNAVLQRAVDDCAAAGGGTVTIPAGIYRLTNSLFLRSRVNIVGDGRAVLLKVPSVSSPIADYLGYGHYEVTVTQPAKFKVGMGLHVTDKQARGFYETIATVTGKRGNILFIDHFLNHDYAPSANGRANTLFPLVAGYDVRLDALEVRHYNGDGISFQQCTDIAVTNCHIHHLRGAGLHPGSGSVRYVFRGNRVHDNAGCGLFYCLRTKYSICEDNVFEQNGDAGISIGERDTHHLIRRNVIRANTGPGIIFRKPINQGGDDVVIKDNWLEKNKGRAIVLVPQLRGVILSANIINGRRQSRRLTHQQVGPAAAPADAALHLNIRRLQ